MIYIHPHFYTVQEINVARLLPPDIQPRKRQRQPRLPPTFFWPHTSRMHISIDSLNFRKIVCSEVYAIALNVSAGPPPQVCTCSNLFLQVRFSTKSDPFLYSTVPVQYFLNLFQDLGLKFKNQSCHPTSAQRQTHSAQGECPAHASLVFLNLFICLCTIPF